MAAVFVYHYVPVGNFYGRTRAQTRGDIIRGINAAKVDYRKRYKVDVRARHSSSEGVRINVQPVVINGQHYAGMASKGQIYLHSGYHPAGSRNIWTVPLSLGRVVFHELRHTRGAGHVSDVRDLMHANGGPDLTASYAWFRGTFGLIKPRSMQESGEVETAIFGRRDGCPVGRWANNKLT